MHPIYDTGKLTDDELLARIAQASNYLHMQTMLGHNPTVESIKSTLAALEDERQQRIRTQITTEQNRKAPVVNNAITLGELDTKEKPAFVDEDERSRVAKIKRRRL